VKHQEQCKKLQREVDTVKEANDALERDLASARAEVRKEAARCATVVEKGEIEKGKLQDKCRALQREVTSHQDNASVLAHELAAAENKADVQRNRIIALENELAEAEQQAGQLAAQLVEEKGPASPNMRQVDSLQREAQEAQSALRRAEVAHEELKGMFSALEAAQEATEERALLAENRALEAVTAAANQRRQCAAGHENHNHSLRARVRELEAQLAAALSSPTPSAIRSPASSPGYFTADPPRSRSSLTGPPPSRGGPRGTHWPSSDERSRAGPRTTATGRSPMPSPAAAAVSPAIANATKAIGQASALQEQALELASRLAATDSSAEHQSRRGQDPGHDPHGYRDR